MPNAIENTGAGSPSYGVPVMGVRNDSGATTRATVDGNHVALALDSAGRLLVAPVSYLAPAKASTATLTNVPSSASNVTVVAANANRLGVLIVNDSTATLYLKFGATATTSSFSVKMEPGSYWEMPEPLYVGIIDGIWSSADGAARVTELT